MILGRQFNNIATGVGNYFGGIAREARDIPTAFATNVSMAKNNAAKTTSQNDPMNVAGEQNVYKQVKDVAGALLGKSGTRSDQYSKEYGYMPEGKVQRSTQPTKPNTGKIAIKPSGPTKIGAKLTGK